MFGFHKMHGLGNSFIFFDELGQDLAVLKNPRILRLLCSSGRGLGGDGVIFIQPPRDKKHHCRMQMFNTDGTEAEMCGNAIRGVAHLYRQHHLGHEPLLIETLSGVKEIHAGTVKDGKCQYRVEMGKPSFDLTATGELLSPRDRKPLHWQEETLEPVYVNIGNPHAMLFLSSPLTQDEMIALGAWLEVHPNHPRRINVEFVEILSPQEAKVTVWERGCGMTQACGTGATAVAAAGIKLGKLTSPVTVHMPGGDLVISQDERGVLFMTGPIQEVAVGQLSASFLHGLGEAGA